MNQYTRRLPHRDAINARQFVTFRLHGTLPSNRVFPAKNITAGQAFVATDRLLDLTRSGPAFLRQPEIAEMVVTAIHDGAKTVSTLRTSFLRRNAEPRPSPRHLKDAAHYLAEITKCFTGHRALKLLHKHGAFWQDESYDHLVRNDEEFSRILRYIEWNPVKAGLVSLPEQFQWSSAGQKAVVQG